MKPLKAGSEVDAWCTKCRLDLNHRIVALVQGRPKRVVCLTCGSQHNYRAPKGQQQPASRRTVKSSARTSVRSPSRASSAEQQRLKSWEEQVAGRREQDFRPYSMDAHFSEGELIMHKKFGQGYIQGVLEDGKVQVMFQGGARTLAHRSE